MIQNLISRLADWLNSLANKLYAWLEEELEEIEAHQGGDTVPWLNINIEIDLDDAKLEKLIAKRGQEQEQP